MTRIYKEFLFDAAHYLPDAPEGHPNRRVHGHSFRVTLWLEGPVSPKTGLIRHFEEIDREIAPLREKIDHHMLNEIPGLENPTLENIAVWLWKNLKTPLPELARIEVHRASCREGCVYDGPESK
ncbi:MAG: 6-carboxytetrahydropterin synthase [Parvibaculum sp.]|uniref:6-pyruvoyl trahydropterin synthase family protein n=1 Tax=Parvibaculum sp. TaxID=2024848 RepID=UPI000DCB4202|nr:6-carboxytetrahydropterin synthase [Parvibaculum sp.]MDR3498570.1 6-carboxytetrahydropterin synthase [Parvibaculum sp.]RAW02524.1 6-carboxytetrahydropterin synthase [Aerococcus urinae]